MNENAPFMKWTLYFAHQRETNNSPGAWSVTWLMPQGRRAVGADRCARPREVIRQLGLEVEPPLSGFPHGAVSAFVINNH